MTRIYCQACGTELEDGLCPKCGEGGFEPDDADGGLSPRIYDESFIGPVEYGALVRRMVPVTYAKGPQLIQS